MASPEQMRAWLDKNPDKAGSPDFVRVTEELSKTGGTPAAAPAEAPSLWGRVKTALGAEPATAPASDLPDIKDVMKEQSETSDPYSAGNTAGRVLTGAIGGIPDLGIGLYNAGARTVGAPGSQIDYLTPQMQERGGVAPLPADAGAVRQLLEGAGSAFLGGGAGAAGTAVNAGRTAGTSALRTTLNAVAPTVVPTVTSHYGGEAGGYLGEKFLGDRETGALLGSILGGVAPAAAPAARSVVHSRYSGAGKIDAPDLNAMAERQGVIPTAGMLGNDSILRREQTLVGQGGSAPIVADARRTAREQLGSAYDAAAERRGATATDPTQGTIGYDVADVARRGVDDANLRSSQGQQDLMQQIGPRSDVDVSGIRQAMTGVRGRTDPMTSAPIDARLAALDRMVRQNAANLDPDTGAVIARNVPYERVKDFRTNLRVKGEGYDPVPGHHAEGVYDAMTGAMRDTGAAQGVPPAFFDTIQGRTARLTGEGGPVQTLTPVAEGGEMNAYNYLRRGEQQPSQIRSLQNTGISDIDRVLGDYMRQIGNTTINDPAGGARGPINLTNRYTAMHPEARQAILGPELNNVADIAGLARSLNIPTSQHGLTRALGQQGEGVARMLVGQEALGAAGAATGIPGAGMAGRVLGTIGMPGIRALMASVLEGPTARNALAGGAAPGGINQLAAALAATGTANEQQRQPVRVEIPTDNLGR